MVGLGEREGNDDVRKTIKTLNVYAEILGLEIDNETRRVLGT